MKDNFSKILDTILSDADIASEKIISDASAKAQKLLNDTEAEIKAEQSKAASDLKEQVIHNDELVLSEFPNMRRDKILSLKHELISESFEKAGKQLVSMSDSEKLKLYASLIRKYADEGSYSIVLNERDYTALGNEIGKMISSNAFPGSPVLSDKRADISGGLRLDFGNVTIDASFETLLNEVREKYMTDVRTILFGEKE